MKLSLIWSEEVRSRFPNLAVCAGAICNVKVERQFAKVERLKESIMEKVRQNYKTESLKDDSTVRAYRDLYWSLGIDPTKTRPSGEALLRRVLNGNEIPSILNVVDAYNLTSLETIIPLSGFDQDQVFPPLEIRFSNAQDEFLGIGMDKPARITEKTLLLADRKRILCIYPYRDAQATRITEETHDMLIIGYGAPSVSRSQLVDAVEKALAYIEKVTEGKRQTVNVFQSNQQL